jgi:hypothetical protein
MPRRYQTIPVSPGFSVIKINNSYQLVTQENGYLTCGLGRNIYSYQSASPNGKFKSKKLLYTIEDQVNGHYLLTYNAQAHPQFLSNDELLISYNVNDTYDTIPPDICPSQCKNAFLDRMDADSYRPKFVRVPLGLMGLKELTSFKLQQVGIFPNPAATTLQVTIPSNNEGACTISVFNKMGVVVLTKETQLTPGTE